MNLNPRDSQTLVTPENLEWLGSKTGTNDTDTITLDKDAFTAIYADKFVKSGTVLAKITASGRWGPYDSTLSNGQEVKTDLLVLYQSIDLSGGVHSPAAAMWHGELVSAKLPRQSGAGALPSDYRTSMPRFRVK